MEMCAVANPESEAQSDPASAARKALGEIERDVIDVRSPEAQQEAKAEPSFGPPRGDPARFPGVVGDMTEWITEGSRYPSLPFSTIAALATVGLLAGRRVRSPTGSLTNLYLVGLGPTQRGKKDPMQASTSALYEIGASRLLYGKLKSAVALINRLKLTPNYLVHIDEYHGFLHKVVRSTVGAEHDILDALKELSDYGYNHYLTPGSKLDESVDVFAHA
jgi:hypothetical protein